jgi:predicted MFS family arabinose efflux permease
VTELEKPATAGQEFARAWPVLLAAMLGFGLGLSALPFYTNGMFVEPLGKAFGWSVGDVQTAIALMPIGTVLMAPVIGVLTDRFGARPVALVSLAFYALAFAALSQITSDKNSFYLGWALMAVAGSGTVAITWSRAVNGWFDKGRGLALGLALMGSGVTGIFAAPFANYVIEAYGWRTAYLALGALPGLIALPAALFLFKDPPRVSAAASALVSGLSFSAAVKTTRFWIMWIAVVLVSIGVGGVISNMMQILTADGLDRNTAVLAMATIGLTVIVGRIFAGFLIDRIWAPLVAAIFLSIPALSCVILAYGEAPVWALFAAAALVGLAAGAEFDLIAFMVSRYFGMKAYAKIYALQFIGFGLASGFAAPLFGRVFDAYKSYDPILYAAAGMFVVGALMFLLLGRYPKEFAAGRE